MRYRQKKKKKKKTPTSPGVEHKDVPGTVPSTNEPIQP